MNKISLLIAVSALTLTASADTLSLTGIASGSSRFNDNYSDAFGQLDLSPEGFYAISNPGLLYGSGYDVFPNDDAFALGTLSHGSLTGVGAESSPITGLTGNWNLNVDTSWGSYSTSFSGVSGSADFLDGALTGLTLLSTVQFTYTDGPLAGAVYEGAFNVAGANWTLNAGNVYSVSVDHEWELAGTVTVVPEPGSLALVGLGMIGLWIARRSRD